MFFSTRRVSSEARRKMKTQESKYREYKRKAETLDLIMTLALRKSEGTIQSFERHEFLAPNQWVQIVSTKDGVELHIINRG